MAEGGNNSEQSNTESWENWFGGWVQTAKEKSHSAMEFMKKDLAEFSCTMQRETEKAVEMTKESLNRENANQATSKVKAGLHTFLDSISKALVIPPDDDYVPVKVAADGSGLYDRGKARLHAVQLDASTYVDAPRGPHEQYKMWLESFNMDQHKGEISELLVSKVEVRALYTKLVPSEVSHAEFWQRYFYRVHQLECDEARKQALMMRADQNQTKGDSFSWDDDEDWSGGEDDDGNQSDWEKMPRPSQSVEKTPVEQSQKEINSSPAPAKQAPLTPALKVVPGTKDPSLPEISTNKDISLTPDSKVNISNSQAPAHQGLQSAETGTGHAESQDHSDKAESSQAEQTSLPVSQDAASETGFLAQIQKPLSEIWNLTLGDTASASHSEKEDGDSAQTGLPDLGSPSYTGREAREVDHVQEQDNSNIGVSSSAAADGDIPPISANESEATAADGACGAADMRPVASRLEHTGNVKQTSPEVSAASVEAKPEPVMDQDITPSHVGLSDDLQYVNDSVTSDTEATPSSISDVISKNEDVQNDQSTPCSPALAPQSIGVADTTQVEVKKADTPQNSLSTDSSLATAITVSENDKMASVEPLAKSVKVAETPKQSEEMEIGMKVKGDMVVVGETASPSSSESSELKELGLDEDWEQDFDIEVTEEELKAAEDIAKKLGESLNVEDDDWENWE